MLARSVRWQAAAALAKAGFMIAFGLAVLAEAAYKVFHPLMCPKWYSTLRTLPE